LGITRVEVNEYSCELCGYKWINRVNGKDGPVPRRCAKCKHQHWERGHLTSLEKSYQWALKKRFGYYRCVGRISPFGGWNVEENIKKYLQRRPSVEEMRVLLHPMCYFYKSDGKGCIPTSDKKYVDIEATKKAHEYERELSRQLLKELMTQRGIPYDEKEAKLQSLWMRYGKYAVPLFYHVPELCDALKKDIPELTNEDIKARILKDFSPQFQYLFRPSSFEEVIQNCWPDWLKR
jgi:hypothetical protein